MHVYHILSIGKRKNRNIRSFTIMLKNTTWGSRWKSERSLICHQSLRTYRFKYTDSRFQSLLENVVLYWYFQVISFHSRTFLIRFNKRIYIEIEIILGSCWNQNFQKSIQTGNQDAASVFDSIDQNSPFANPFTWSRIHLLSNDCISREKNEIFEKWIERNQTLFNQMENWETDWQKTCVETWNNYYF